MKGVSSDPRQVRFRKFDAHYREIGDVGVDPCIYCGVISDSYDHIPPLVAIEKLSLIEIDGDDLKKYPACRECNSWLGDRLITTLKERREEVRRRLKNKYRHFVQMPDWSEDELGELSTKLSDDVQRHVRFSRWVKARLSWTRG